MVARSNPVSEEVVDELLGQCPGLHIGVHVDVLYKESGILEHCLDGDDIRMDLTPAQRLHCHVDVLGAGSCDFQHGSYAESRARVSVVLNLDVRILVLDSLYESSQESRTSDTCHILEADFVCTILYNLVNHAHIVLYGMDRGVGDTKSCLCNHSGFLGMDYGTLEVAVVVQSAEGTHNVGSLSLLDLCHQCSHVIWHREHSQCVQTSFKHVGLDTGLVERSGPFPDSLVRILSEKEVHLLEGTTVGFNSVEASHVDDNRCNLLKHSYFRHIFA